MLTARGKHALNKNRSSVEQDALLSITGFSEPKHKPLRLREAIRLDMYEQNDNISCKLSVVLYSNCVCVC